MIQYKYANNEMTRYRTGGNVTRVTCGKLNNETTEIYSHITTWARKQQVDRLVIKSKTRKLNTTNLYILKNPDGPLIVASSLSRWFYFHSMAATLTLFACVYIPTCFYTHTTRLTSSLEPCLFGLAQCLFGLKKRLAKALVMAHFPKPLRCHSILKDPLPKLHLSHYTMKGVVKGYGFTIDLSQVFSKASVKPHPCNSILKDPFC